MAALWQGKGGVPGESHPLSQRWVQEGFSGEETWSRLRGRRGRWTAGDVEEHAAARGNWAGKSGRWEGTWARGAVSPSLWPEQATRSVGGCNRG